MPLQSGIGKTAPIGHRPYSKSLSDLKWEDYDEAWMGTYVGRSKTLEALGQWAARSAISNPKF